MTAIYNEWDAYIAAWLRNLIEAGLIAPGSVDERSICDLRATDLRGRVQFHTFAGIGGWGHALRLANWPDDRPVWSASCPCQPFSDAGLGRGVDDERHLWPVVAELVRECRPPVLFGEQSASSAGLAWFAAVRADLEGAGYAVGAADLCAAGVGAPHRRQRLYFAAVRMGDADVHAVRRDARAARREEAPIALEDRPERVGPRPASDDVDWSQCEWVTCDDPVRGRIERPVEPGTRPLVARSAGDLGKLRAYGNGLCVPVAAEFIRAVTPWIDAVQARAA